MPFNDRKGFVEKRLNNYTLKNKLSLIIKPKLIQTSKQNKQQLQGGPKNFDKENLHCLEF
jgi:hypothetical protein